MSPRYTDAVIWIAINDEPTINDPDLDDEPYIECPVCTGPGELMGCLGYLAWYRCINCGMEFNVQLDNDRKDKTE